MKKRRGAIVRSLLAVFLLMCLVLPASVAYAETPLSVDSIAAGVAADGIGSPFQHHSFVYDGTHWVLIYDSGSSSVLAYYSDDGLTWTPLMPGLFGYNSSGMTASETKGGQFDTWLERDGNVVHIAYVNTSANNSDILYASYTVAGHTLTKVGLPPWNRAVAGVANISYRNPTICVNNNDSVFLTYGSVNNSISDVYVTTTNDSTDAIWLPEIGFPMSNLDGNVSLPAMYGSIIPLFTSTANVSVQCANSNGSVYKILQVNISWNGTAWNKGTTSTIDTSGWYLKTGFEWNYNAVSMHTPANENDIAIQCGQYNGSLYRTFFNRRANESDAWGSSGVYARNFGQGAADDWYVGAMGIRSSAHNLVWSGWDMLGGSEHVYSADYDNVTGDWTGPVVVYHDADIPMVSTMANYFWDFGGDGEQGFIYGTDTSDIVMYGLYGPATTTASTIPASVTAMAWIVILVFGALICIILLAYGASESIKGNGTEFVKIGAVGLLTLIIAAMIVEALL